MVHTKPFIYGPAYINGILVAYLMSNNLLENIYKSQLTKSAMSIVKTVAILSFLVGSSRYTLTDGLPLFSAIESSLFSPVLSIIIMYELIDIAQFESTLKRFLSKHMWIPLRSSLRVSYISHPVLLNMLADYYPDIDASNIFTYLIILTVFVIMTYILAIPLTIVFEMPLIGLSSRLTEHLFQIEEKDEKKA